MAKVTARFRVRKRFEKYSTITGINYEVEIRKINKILSFSRTVSQEGTITVGIWKLECKFDL